MPSIYGGLSFAYNNRMSYKLSQFITAVNAALNYPAITYDDVALYVDMCVGEINTTLHTSLRGIRECRDALRNRVLTENAPLVLATEPAGDSAALPINDGTPTPSAWQFWAVKDANYRKFVHVDANGDVDGVRDSLFGVHVSDGVPKAYEAHSYSDALCLWVASDGYSDLDLGDYLPEDWVSLFLIPYVCFKYTVRDGGVASTFAEEMEQGFQQLQEAYDVPDAVELSQVAGLPAYRDDVKERLESGRDLGGKCPTRAITESMKHPRAIGARFGSMYDAGGWGV